MKIYKDAFSGDELFTDTYPMEEIGGTLYHVFGKHETRKEGDIVLEGSNASAEGEDADDGSDPTSISGIDIVLNHRLVQTGFGSKKDYMEYLKIYMKKVVTHMEANGKGADDVKTFKKSITDNLVPMLKNFKELDFYIGEGMDTSNGMILILDYKEYKGEERPYFIAFKHGLEEEKV